MKIINYIPSSVSEALPASYPGGTGCSFPGDKQLEYEADQSAQSHTKFKNAQSYTVTH